MRSVGTGSLQHRTGERKESESMGKLAGQGVADTSPYPIVQAAKPRYMFGISHHDLTA